MRKTKVFSGTSHPELSNMIVERLGMAASAVSMQQYANHELALHLGVSVRGDDVFLIQSGSDNINDHLMELLIMIYACKIASARRITAVIPYFPYGKWSKKKKSRGCITAKLVANMLAIAGVNHVITMDLHSSQIQGFFTTPVDNLFAEPSIAKYVKEKIPNYQQGVVVSKNAGGVKRVTSLADRLKLDFALIHKDSTKQNATNVIGDLKTNFSKVILTNQSTMSTSTSIDSIQSLQYQQMVDGSKSISDLQGLRQKMSSMIQAGRAFEEEEEANEEDEDDQSDGDLTLVGDVQDKIAFIVDDIIDGTKSYLDASVFLGNQCGAKCVYIIATHGILSNNALLEIENCSYVSGVIVTNTYPIPEEKRQMSTKLHVIDISGVMSEAIRRTKNGESISYLFDAAIV